MGPEVPLELVPPEPRAGAGWHGAVVQPPTDTGRLRQRAPDDCPLWRLPTLWVLAGSVFAAITTEVLPVGLLPQISTRLEVGESRSGLLVSVYAVIVAVGSIPLTAVVARWPRRTVLGVLLTGYAVSNAVFAQTSLIRSRSGPGCWAGWRTPGSSPWCSPPR